MAINNMRELRGYSDFREVPHPFDGGVSTEDARRLKHGYYASVSYVDAQVGRLLDALADTAYLQDTIVVLWSDHGFHLGEKRQPAQAPRSRAASSASGRMPLRIPPAPFPGDAAPRRTPGRGFRARPE